MAGAMVARILKQGVRRVAFSVGGEWKLEH
jgi:hypothetical protein